MMFATGLACGLLVGAVAGAFLLALAIVRGIEDV